jgi:hypothetical protein
MYTPKNVLAGDEKASAAEWVDSAVEDSPSRFSFFRFMKGRKHSGVWAIESRRV